MTEDKLRVLVVDDEKLVRWSQAEHLGRIGYESSSAATGEAALELITVDTPDVVILDVRLPGIDGLEVLRRAKLEQPEIAVIVMSAHGTIDLAVEALKLGASDFLIKPFTFAELDETIEEAVALRLARKRMSDLVGNGEDEPSGILGESAAISRIRELVARVAASDGATVLIDGPSGAGKEVVARALHKASARASKPFFQVNCGSLPPDLLESELFGHERGAFTNAHVRKPGLVETAAGGTIFLDEISELPLQGQVKLLQLLDRKTFRRVGGTVELHADVRIVVATNRDLETRVAEDRFREDLFHRLNVVAIHVPPLCERPEDVARLAAHFIRTFQKDKTREPTLISPIALEAMTRYTWPGNVRELRNIIERAFILDPDVVELDLQHLPSRIRKPSGHRMPALAELANGRHPTMAEAERHLIERALERASGNQSKAARELAISRDTLRYRMKKYGML